MIRNAIRSSNCVRIAAGLLVAGAAMPAIAQDEGDEVVRGRSPNAMDVASTPLNDLNLSKDDIPEALTDAVTAPYASERMAACEDIAREISRLDAVLGADLDVATGERRDITLGKIAKSAVGSFIPFRGIIREVSGAADHQRDFEEAIVAGAIRRGYLKGLGQARECPYPARPATTRIRMDDAPPVDNELRRNWSDTDDE
ncbi:MAG: hypothetical protein WA948_08090 [Pontixanthobacter sp.]